MPEVDQALARELNSLFDVESVLECPTLEQCASAQAAVEKEVEEEDRRASEVNAWAAAGCSLTITPEDAAARAETARARALGRRYRAEQEKLHRETRRVLSMHPHCLCHTVRHPKTSCSPTSCHPLLLRYHILFTTPQEKLQTVLMMLSGGCWTLICTLLALAILGMLVRQVPGFSQLHRCGYALTPTLTPAATLTPTLTLTPTKALTTQHYVRTAHPDRHRGSARAARRAPPRHHGFDRVAPSPHG